MKTPQTEEDDDGVFVTTHVRCCLTANLAEYFHFRMTEIRSFVQVAIMFRKHTEHHRRHNLNFYISETG